MCWWGGGVVYDMSIPKNYKNMEILSPPPFTHIYPPTTLHVPDIFVEVVVVREYLPPLRHTHTPPPLQQKYPAHVE